MALRNGRKPAYQRGWRTYSEKVRAEWVATRGWVCPGYPPTHPAHASHDLVVDHDLGVMCRTANAIKANTFDRARAQRRR